MINLRPFDAASESDYDALAQLKSATLPDYAETVAAIKDDDAQYAGTGKPWGRLFARDDSGAVVGMSEFAPALWQPGAGKFYLELLVHPEWQGRGVGKQLYDALTETMRPHEPTWLKTECREDYARAARFFTDRGFRETMRHYESRLDLAAFDPVPFTAAWNVPGVQFVSYRALLATDPDAPTKNWQAAMEMLPDVPGDEPFVPQTFAAFQSLVMDRPALDLDGYFVTVDENTGEYVGLSHIWRRSVGSDLDTGLTAVKRAYRRRGIALSLKLRVVAWARENGFRELRTSNEVANRAMLGINERLGFVKLPPWIELVWRMG